MANVRKLMRLAREYEAQRGPRPARLPRARRRRAPRATSARAWPRSQAEGHDGVRVMTVHAAKGLEFPVVAVADLGRGLDRRPPQRRPGDRAAAVAGRAGARSLRDAARVRRREVLRALGARRPERGRGRAESEEGCRLVYVAASRAEDRLILSGILPAERRSSPPSRRSRATRRCAACCPRSRRRGWDGGAQIVTLPGARPIESADRLPEAALEIRISEPGPERAAELVRRFDPPPEPEPLAGVVAPPPLVEARAAPFRSATSPTRRSPSMSGAATASTSSGSSAPASRSRPALRPPTPSRPSPRTSSPSPR